MENNKVYNVTNRSAGIVVYNVPELRTRRQFSPGETKKIGYEELSMLAQVPGGDSLLRNYLMVQDPEVIEEITNRKVEPEYWLKKEDIPKWMNACSLDEFKDALDFAPDGIKDLIKNYAVSLPLQSYDKLQALKDQLNFDALKAIELSKPDKGEETAAKATTRRTEASSITTPEQESTPVRRTTSTVTVKKPE